MAVSKRLSQQSAAKAVKPPKPEEVEEDMEDVEEVDDATSEDQDSEEPELVEAEQISEYPPKPATTSTPAPVKVNPDLFATLLAQGKIKTEGGQGRKLCPDCRHFIGARSGECPACGHQFPPAEPSNRTPRATYTPAKPIMGPQDYKRLSRAANRFRALFDSEDQALEVLEVAATLLDYCRHSLDEAASWIREDEDEDDGE